MSFTQKIKSTFVDENGNRKHLLPKHRIPQAPPAPAKPLTAELPAEPLTSENLLVQKELLQPVAGQAALNQGYDANLLQGNRLSQSYETTYVQSAQRSSITAQPTVLETIQKDVVIQERIHPIEKEEIQPIIYREREQLDVRQITQMLHETQIQPTVLEQRELPAERREAIVERSAPIPENIVLPTTTRDATLRTEVVHAPIVNEVIKKTVIEEVQPVLERDIFVPTIVQNTQPIYEKIVEAPTLIREVRDMRAKSVEYVQPVQTVVREQAVQQPPKIEFISMSTTTTTNEVFVPAKLIKEGELRNWQPASAAPLSSKAL